MQDFRTIGPQCTLGEGPLWHPLLDRLFWFDIPEGIMYSCDADGSPRGSVRFGEPASACGWVDSYTLLVATATGLQELDVASGTWQPVIAVEEDDQQTRTNDGRIAPDGSFWFGTMADDMTPKKGTYYRYSRGMLETIAETISIPNATCFAPDGRTAYFADTRTQIIWRMDLDEDGSPVGERKVHIDLQSAKLNPDGAVCDEEGFLWNAQYGASRIVRYTPDGREDRVIDLPVSQPTCPAFGGPDMKTLFITSATQNLPDHELVSQPHAGKIICLQVDVPGFQENRATI